MLLEVLVTLAANYLITCLFFCRDVEIHYTEAAYVSSWEQILNEVLPRKKNTSETN